jgi:hypothetical protein
VSGDRARGVGRVKNVTAHLRRPLTLHDGCLFPCIMCARTIRVVFAAKLLKNFTLNTLSLLSLPSITAFAGTCARSASIRTGQSERSRP